MVVLKGFERILYSRDMNKVNKLVRPRKGRKIAGVAAGLAGYMGGDVTGMRLIWVLLLVPGGLPGIIPYLICWLIIPEGK